VPQSSEKQQKSANRPVGERAFPKIPEVGARSNDCGGISGWYFMVKQLAKLVKTKIEL
jgi:hypothetical protein